MENNLAFIELHGGIILNMNLINIIKPSSSASAPDDGKIWIAETNGSSVQITNKEYNTIKTYYKSKSGLY